jgi:hypothetical protein
MRHLDRPTLGDAHDPQAARIVAVRLRDFAQSVEEPVVTVADLVGGAERQSPLRRRKLGMSRSDSL